jgi:hypothetical protein
MWKTKVKMTLIRERLWAVVEGRTAHPESVPTEANFPEDLQNVSQIYDNALRLYEELNERAYATILLTINDSPLVHVQNLTNAKEIWETLGDLYGVKGYTARHLILKSLVSTTLQGSASVGDYIDHIKKYGQQLSEMGYKLEDWILTSMLLHNLGEAYDAFVASTLQSVRDTEPEFDVIVYQLLDEERRKQTGDPCTALFTKGRKQ